MSKLTCVALSLLTASFMTYLAARHTVLPQPRQGFGLLGREAAGNSTTTPPCASLGACTSELAGCLHEENAAVAATVQSYVNQQPARLRVELALFSMRPRMGGLTVATQTSTGRMHLLEDLCRHWVGPLAAAVYLPIVAGDDRPEDPHMDLDHVTAAIQDLFDRMEAVSGGCQLDVTLVTELVADKKMFGLVPVNAARNMAVLLARTELLMMVDIDFLVSRELSDIVRDPVRYDEILQLARNRSAIVLPAFRSEEQDVPVRVVIGGKRSAVQLFDEGRLLMFQNDSTVPDWAQEPCDHIRWLTAAAPYTIEYKSGFEPWVIVNRFVVHHDGFIVHRPHGTSGTSAKTASQMRDTWGNNTHWYYHGDMREMRNGTYRVVVSEAFDACRARLPWWQIYPLSGGLVKTRYVPFRLDDDGAAAASA